MLFKLNHGPQHTDYIQKILKPKLTGGKESKITKH